MTDLITKLEEAGEGDVRLDVEIAKSCGYYVPAGPMQGWHDPDGKHIGLLPRFTQSLDAALALAERVLPGQEYEITTLYGVARVALNLNHGDQPGPHYGHNDCGNVALALCAAILRASEQERGG